MRLIRSVWYCLIPLWAAVSTARAGTNLLLNPGFLYAADGTTNSGESAQNWQKWGETSRESWGSYDGDGYLASIHNWNSTNSSGGWYQDVSATPHTRYALGGYFCADTNYSYSALHLKLEFFDSSSTLLSAATTLVSGVGVAWDYFEVEATAPAGASVVRCVVAAEGQSNTAAFKLDALSLVVVDTNRPALLEPDEGVLTGVNLDWVQSSPLAFNQATKWDHVVFVDFIDFPQSSYSSLDSRLGAVREVGGIYLLTLEPHNSAGGIENITSNDCQNFAGWCAYWNNQGVPIIIRFAHEMNGDWYDWRMKPHTYRNKFRLLANIIHQTATNTAMLWAPNVAGSYPYGDFENITMAGYLASNFGTRADWYLLDSNGDGVLSDDVSAKDDPYAPFYPGDRYVDWVGMTIYHWGSYYPWWYNAWPEERKLFDQITGNYAGYNGDDTWNPDFYAEYAEGHNKPMMIPETAAYYRPSDPTPPAGYPNYTNDELVIKQRWLEQVYNVYGDNSNALDIADHFPLLKGINWFNHYKQEAEAQNDWVNWTVTSNADVLSEYYDRLNSMKNGRRYFLHADDLAGYVYSWNCSLEGWTNGPPPFHVAVDTSFAWHGRAAVRIYYDDTSPPYGSNVMMDLSAMQDARSWSNYNAVYLHALVPTNVSWASYRLIMQSAETTWDILATTSCPPDGAWHRLVFPYDWSKHDESSWLNLYLQVDLPTGSPAVVYADALQAVSDNDHDGSPDDQDTDDDNDGMPDWYENAYGLDPFDPADAGVDSDDDGFTNLQESRTNTDPFDSNSCLRVIGISSESDRVVLWWEGRSGVTYKVQMATRLDPADWQDHLSPPGVEETSTITVTDTVAGIEKGYYRLCVP